MLTIQLAKLQLLLTMALAQSLGFTLNIVLTCYVRTFFIVFPSSSFQEGCPLCYYTTVVMQCTIQKPLLLLLDIIVVRLQYNDPYGHFGLIGYLRLTHDFVVLAQCAPI
jgi:hypothetical protein